MFLKLATGVGNDTMFALLVELHQDCTQAPRFFVISETGNDNEHIGTIFLGVVDNRLGAQVGLKFLE